MGSVRMIAPGQLAKDFVLCRYDAFWAVPGEALTRGVGKHTIDGANVKVHVFVQAGAEAVNEGDCANLQYCLF